MLKTSLRKWGLLAAALLLSTSSGCMLTSLGPSLGILSIPMPVSPYFQYASEEKAFEDDRYKKMKVLDPIPAGQPHLAEDAPSEDMVMRAFLKMHPVAGNFPAIYEVQHNDVRIVMKKLQDLVDEPRMYPVIGMAQLHHSHWECKVYFTEIIRNGWPNPHTIKNEERLEVIKIDLDHLHRVGNVVPGDMN